MLIWSFYYASLCLLACLLACVLSLTRQHGITAYLPFSAPATVHPAPQPPTHTSPARSLRPGWYTSSPKVKAVRGVEDKAFLELALIWYDTDLIWLVRVFGCSALLRLRGLIGCLED